MESEQRLVKTVCNLCYANCGIDVYVQDGKIARVEGMSEHPLNRGNICVKARQLADFVYSGDRLKYPMRKENGGWKRISWEEALDTIATKLKESREMYGSSSLFVFTGDPVVMYGTLGWDMALRFCDAYETPNRAAPGHLCYSMRIRSDFVTLGKHVLAAEPEKAKCIILWGHNPHSSLIPFVWRVNEAKRKGAKLVVIDPRRTPFARKADIHVQPRPGTDGALALAMLNTIISEGLYDKEFVEKWTVGFDRLAERVKQYPPEEVEQITWVAAEDIRKIARIYATNKPACIREGSCSVHQEASGFQNTRALAILQAITGNIDIPGGWARPSLGVPLASRRIPEKQASIKFIGAERYPLAHKVGTRLFGEGQAIDWADVVITGKPYPVKNMIASGCNLAVTWPNSTKVKDALEKLDLLVVMDLFMTATAELAHIVLPACTFIERVVPYHHVADPGLPLFMLGKKAIEPLWECWSDCRFWTELAKRMGYGEYFPWEDDEEALDYFLKPSGLTVKYLTEEHPTGLVSRSYNYEEYKEKGFRTSTGKIELYSELMEKLGYDPLPNYQEPPESPISNPELAKEYPVILTTGARIREYWHSQHRNLTKLRRRVPEPLAEIHPVTAQKYGIRDGEWMTVETKRGSIDIKAKVTEDIIPNVVSIPHGWTEANANILTDDTPADPIAGYPSFRGLLCKIGKKA